MRVSFTLAILFQAPVLAGEPPPTLYVIENITSARGVVETRNLVRLSMDRDNNLVKETLLSKDQSFFGHGGHRLALNRFVVTRFGSVIDVQSKKVIHDEEYGELLGIEGEKAVYRIDNSSRPIGLFSFDLNKHNVSKVKAGEHWDLPGAISPDKTMSVVHAGSVIWLHQLKKAPLELSKDFGFTYSRIAGPSGRGPKCLWLDGTRILTVKANNKLAVLNTQGMVERFIEVEDAPAEVLSPPWIWRDNKENVIYTCGGKHFLIDVQKGTASALKNFSLGHGFEASVAVDTKRRHTMYLAGKEIGKWVFNPFHAATAPGRLAFACTEPSENANLGQVEGLAVWDARVGDWRVSKMWVNDVIGWSK